MFTTNETVVNVPVTSVTRSCTVMLDAAVVLEVTDTVRDPADATVVGVMTMLDTGKAVVLLDASTLSNKLPVPPPTITFISAELEV